MTILLAKVVSLDETETYLIRQVKSQFILKYADTGCFSELSQPNDQLHSQTIS